MGILIGRPESQLLHRFRRCIAQVDRNGEVPRLFHGLQGFVNSQIGPVGLGTAGQVDGAFTKRNAALGHAEALHRLKTRRSHGECLWIGQANVFGSSNDQPARNEGVLFAAGDQST